MTMGDKPREKSTGGLGEPRKRWCCESPTMKLRCGLDEAFGFPTERKDLCSVGKISSCEECFTWQMSDETSPTFGPDDLARHGRLTRIQRCQCS